MSRIVYGILCHNSAEYVQEQYKLMYAPDTQFIYHADEKSPANLKDYLNQLALRNPNVSVVSSILCSWAGFSLTKVMLQIIEAATELEDWDHLIFLSEQHLPLQSHEYISDAVKLNHNYLEAHPYRTFWEQGKIDIHNRSAQLYRELPGVGAFGTISNDPGDVFFDRLRHGSQWMTLCRATCLQLVAAEGKYDLKFFENSILSDENAIQSWATQLKNDSVTNINQIVTFVADPSRGGSKDMTFDEDLFFVARDTGRLFIRKRMATIPPRMTAYFDQIFPISQRPPSIALRTPPPAFNQPLAAQSLVRCMNEQTAAMNCELVPMRRNANTPNLFCKIHHADIKPPFNIYIVSQDLFHFKVLTVLNEPFKGFGDMTVGGYRASVVRARLNEISFHREIHLAPDYDFGFYTMKELSDLTGLIDLIKLHVSRTAALTVI
jgi:hypothetical protein